MEEKVEKKEQSTVEEMTAMFNSGWETVVEVIVQLTGLTREAARNTILVAIVPLLTAAVQMVNWLYLYLHYHLGYNVPAVYLTAEMSWVVSFGAGVLLIVAMIALWVLWVLWADAFFKRSPEKSVIAMIAALIALFWPVIAAEALLVLLLSGDSNGFEFYGAITQVVIASCWFINGFVFWGIFTDIAADEGNNKEYERDRVEKQSYNIIVVLDSFIILAICAWWFRPLLARWGLQLEISFYTWLVCSVYIFMLIGNSMFAICKPQRIDAIFQLCLMIVLTIFCIALVDNYFDRKAPYAITMDNQQVVVYQSKEVSVLEPATIEADEDTGEVTLTIDTSQQQIVDSTTLSYEYQTFDTVIIE